WEVSDIWDARSSPTLTTSVRNHHPRHVEADRVPSDQRHHPRTATSQERHASCPKRYAWPALQGANTWSSSSATHCCCSGFSASPPSPPTGPTSSSDSSWPSPASPWLHTDTSSSPRSWRCPEANSATDSATTSCACPCARSGPTTYSPAASALWGCVTPQGAPNASRPSEAAAPHAPTCR